MTTRKCLCSCKLKKVNRADFIGAGGGIELGIIVRGNEAELVKASRMRFRFAGLQYVAENLPENGLAEKRLAQDGERLCLNGCGERRTRNPRL